MKQFFLLIAVSAFCFCCESESQKVEEDTDNVLTAGSALLQKLLQLSQHETARDNIIDRSSCISVELPVDVVVNGQPLTVSSVADFQVIRNILAASVSDFDSLTIAFPITVTFRDGSQKLVNSQSELQAAGSCAGSIELPCITIQYPFDVKTYNTQSQLAQSFSISEKRGLFDLLAGMSVTDRLSIVYPIQVSTPDDVPVSVNSNNEFSALIDASTAGCLAGIDPSPGPGPGTSPVQTIEQIITQGNWRVSYFFDSGDQTEDYDSYDFMFNANGTAEVAGGSSSITGTWDAYLDSGEQKIEFTFSGSVLDELEEDWEVIEIATNLIKLRHVSGGGGGTDYLNFEKN